MSTPRFGLALGGGGARGFAHIGVLARLEALGIKPDIITGTSMGAVVAAAYLKMQSAQDTLDELNRLVESEEFQRLGLNRIDVEGRGGESFWHQVSKAIQDRIIINMAHSRQGLVHAERITEALEVVFDKNIWQAGGMKLGIVATDLMTGEDVYFTQDSVVDAVQASISLPGFMPPHELGGRVLVDGGVSQLVPIRLAKEMGADFVLAVDVGQGIEPLTEMDNAMAILSQSDNIRSCHYRDMLNQEADVLLAPEMPGVHWYSYSRRNEFVELGEGAFDLQKVTFQRAWYQKQHPVLGKLRSWFNSDTF